MYLRVGIDALTDKPRSPFIQLTTSVGIPRDPKVGNRALASSQPQMPGHLH
jgi:hypothetical protein